MSNYFRLAKEGAVAVLTFDRNEKRNPLNEDSVSELEANLLAVRDDEQVRALLLTGAGAAFCAGADISRLKGVTDQAERQRLFGAVPAQRRRVLRRTLALLTNLEIPTVAAVNGFAVGGGWFIALACDLRIAVESAEFWMPEVDLGSPGPRAPEQWLTAHVGARPHARGRTHWWMEHPCRRGVEPGPFGGETAVRDHEIRGRPSGPRAEPPRGPLLRVREEHETRPPATHDGRGDGMGPGGVCYHRVGPRPIERGGETPPGTDDRPRTPRTDRTEHVHGHARSS